MNWEPIDTAPRDGTWILLHDPSQQGRDCPAFVGRWDTDVPQWDGTLATGWTAYSSTGEDIYGNSHFAMLTPTHWMPLPPPP